MNLLPTARITATPTSGTVPLVVSLDGRGSTDPDGTISTYSWTFGDGTSASGSTVSKTFQNTGTYNILLRVTDNRGGTASSTTSVTVNPQPTDAKIFVANIEPSTVAAFGGFMARARVSVIGIDGKAKQGAVVRVTWSGLTSGTVSASTGIDGSAYLYSSPTSAKGTFIVTVNQVTLSGSTYDPAMNAESSDSIAAP